MSRCRLRSSPRSTEPERGEAFLEQLVEKGRLHIDDFGTGYSSLETLHRFPVDAFKVDRSFIRSLTSTDNGAELISALVALGKALGLAVVVEGVETSEQLTFLREIGCAAGQGHLFMLAVTGDRAADLLGRSLCAQGPDVAPAQPIRLVPPAVDARRRAAPGAHSIQWESSGSA